MCACVPPPPRRITCRSPKRAQKTLVGVLGRAPTRRARPPPRALSVKKGQKYFGGPSSFSLHTGAAVLTHWLYNWLIIKNGVTLVFS
jgi:hypothetical protein